MPTQGCVHQSQCSQLPILKCTHTHTTRSGVLTQVTHSFLLISSSALSLSMSPPNMHTHIHIHTHTGLLGFVKPTFGRRLLRKEG